MYREVEPCERFGQSDALNFARQIIERGIDVASFKGLDQTDTIQRMTAAGRLLASSPST